MMKYEVKIILEPEISKTLNGGVLENMVREILEKQEYHVDPNVHFTGLEIDLLANHKIKNELLYVECKAKEKPKSTEIKNFIFGVDYGVDEKMVDYGYFIYTEELDKQASALKIRFESSKKNVTFIGPEKIVDLLISIGRIKKIDFSSIEMSVSKTVLAYTYFGCYYVLILQDGSIPKYVSIIDAKLLESPTSETIKKIFESVKEVRGLEILQLFKNVEKKSKDKSANHLIETITEINESENWYDYSPASIKHFIGRNKLRKDLINFIENVRGGKTSNRIFYLDGKSGWGKSSIIAELRGRLNFKFWKQRAFILAIDSRSASTSNFVALAVKKLIEDAIRNKIISKTLFTQNLKITSPYDVLSDASFKELFKELKSKRRILILVFDQFEDVFRKEDLFEAFYKFLLDVNDIKENLIVGFSWKSEINIPIGNPAYHLFSQLKDYSLNIKVPEFGFSDVKNVLKQLEKTINKPLGNDLERRLIDASQGFPWLIKKLCIHTFQQYTSGKTLEELIEQDLNIKSLFESDLEKLIPEESSILNFIASRSYNENALDISEVDETNQTVIDQLIHKRLIIKIGSKYNIYWDIFRDYLVKGDVPVIGESYLIRQSATACLQLFLIFKGARAKTFEEIEREYPGRFAKKTYLNILYELRSIGFLRKIENSDSYEVTEKVTDISKEGFVEYVTKKFQNYNPFIEIKKIEKKKIKVDDIVAVLKNTFKTSEFREATWKAYALNLITWFNYSNLDIKAKIIEIKKGKPIKVENKLDLIFYYTPKALIDYLQALKKDESISNRIGRDLILFDYAVQNQEGQIELTDRAKINNYNDESFLKDISAKALSFGKIKIAYNFFKTNPKAKPIDLLNEFPEITDLFTTEKSKKQVNSVIYSWARFIFNILDLKKISFKSVNFISQGNYFLYSSPTEAINIYNRVLKKDSFIDKYDKMKVKMLDKMSLLNFDPVSLKATISSSITNDLLFKKQILELAMKDDSIREIYGYIKERPKVSVNEIIGKMPHIFSSLPSKISKYNRSCKLLVWAKAIKDEGI